MVYKTDKNKRKKSQNSQLNSHAENPILLKTDFFFWYEVISMTSGKVIGSNKKKQKVSCSALNFGKRAKSKESVEIVMNKPLLFTSLPQ